ncbi:MAG: malto-oligosyltrehalose trehalohydrolase [Desulfohalobiaceae bacterium]
MLRPGPTFHTDGSCTFTVWAPLRNKVSLKILTPEERILPLERGPRGYWRLTCEDLDPATRYLLGLDGETERPDPASHFQPDGVHQPSRVVDHLSYEWACPHWRHVPLQEMVLYELHVGAFSPEGTFRAVIQRLDELCDLGVNTLSLMPVAQFPGSRNWGYDGVHPYAVQNSYGGPEGLKALVDACHQRTMNVVLDVVYNHLGPEGNYLHDFGPYFTDRYRTPWGEAVNFDGPHSDGVREFFICNALHWFEHYRLDGLRLDAVHAIFDHSADHFLHQLARETALLEKRLGRGCLLIAESDRNDSRLIRPPETGGFGLNAQWSDDFHHALHTLLTREDQGYYQDFGQVSHLAAAHEERYVYHGGYSPFRQRRHGNDASDLPGHRFVVCAQNHDQVGNRMLGERLSGLIPFPGLKLSTACVLLSPFVPMLFMGEEYGEEAPFLYFVSHGDPDLVEAVRQGRAAEFSSFDWQGEPPDPQSESTFLRSRLNWSLRGRGRHAELLAWTRELLRLRRELYPLSRDPGDPVQARAMDHRGILTVTRTRGSRPFLALMHFSSSAGQLDFDPPTGQWVKRLDSEDETWGGHGRSLPGILDGPGPLTLPPLSYTLYTAKDKQ